MSIPPRPNSNRNTNQIMMDLKLDKYKSLLEYYKTKYKVKPLMEKFSNLDRIRIQDITNNFEHFNSEQKRDFFELAETNPYVLCTILCHYKTTNSEINRLLYSPSLTPEIALLTATRNSLDKRNAQAICDYLGEAKMLNIYSDYYFKSTAPKSPFCDEIHKLFLVNREKCAKMSFYPLAFVTDESVIQEYIKTHDLSEEEITMICNNRFLSPSFRNRIFDLGADIEELYNKTEHMKTVLNQSAFDTIYEIKPENHSETEIIEDAYTQLTDYIIQNELPLHMEQKIADAVIARINSKTDTQYDRELLRVLYMNTKNYDILKTYSSVNFWNLNLSIAVSHNKFCPEDVLNAIISSYTYKLDTKSYATKNEEGNLVKELEYLVGHKPITFDYLEIIYDTGYLTPIYGIIKSQHTPNAVLQYIIDDEDKRSISLYKEFARLHLLLRQNGLSPDLAETIITQIERPDFFKDCLCSEKEYNQIKKAFDSFLKTDTVIMHDAENVLNELEKGKNRFVKLEKSCLFDISKDKESIKSATYNIDIDVSRMDVIKNKPEDIAQMFLALENSEMISMYKKFFLDKIIENLHHDINAHETLFTSHPCKEIINLYNVIDIYDNIYKNFMGGMKIVDKELRRQEKELKEKNTEEIEKEI